MTNIDTHTQTNKHTGWKHYHLAIAGVINMLQAIMTSWCGTFCTSLTRCGGNPSRDTSSIFPQQRANNAKVWVFISYKSEQGLNKNSRQAMISGHNGCMTSLWFFNTKTRQNNRHIADDIFKCNFLNEKSCYLLLNFTESRPQWSNEQLTMGQHWFLTGKKPSVETMMT